MTTTLKRKFWTAPSGRLHGMRRCSGGAPPLRMKATTLTPAQFLAHPNKCRCARWTAVENGTV